jgi:hypothetical protein
MTTYPSQKSELLNIQQLNDHYILSNTQILNLPQLNDN